MNETGEALFLRFYQKMGRWERKKIAQLPADNFYSIERVHDIVGRTVDNAETYPTDALRVLTKGKTARQLIDVFTLRHVE